MPRMPALTEYISHLHKNTLDGQSRDVSYLTVRSVKTEATKTNTRIEEIPPAAGPICKRAVCATRRVTLAAATTTILLVCSSVEAVVKAEESISSTDKQVSTGTYTLVMRVPGEADAIYWSLNLPKSFGIKYSNLKEKVSVLESGDNLINNKFSRLWMKNIHLNDLVSNFKYNITNLHIRSEENIRIDLFLGSYSYLHSFSKTLSSRIDRMCLRLDVNADGLIPLANDPEKAKFNPTTGLPKDRGSCGIRTDGKSSKFIRMTVSGDYDLEIDCWSNVSPGICRASSSFKGWPIKLAFPASLLNRHADILNIINKFLSFHTSSITTANNWGK